MTNRYYDRERTRAGNYDYDRYGGTQYGRGRSYDEGYDYGYYEPGYSNRNTLDQTDWGYGYDWGPDYSGSRGSSRYDYGARNPSRSYGSPYESYDWMAPGPYTGYGPEGYRRSDDRIRDEVNDRLKQHGRLDASKIAVDVHDGDVALKGEVKSRRDKRTAEDTVESVMGVRDVHNELHVNKNKKW